MRLSLTLHRDGPGGPVLAHLGPHATACRWLENEHGDRDLSVTVRARVASAFRLYAAPGALWLVASDGGRASWVGLLDEPGLWVEEDASGVTMRALGRWAALDDLVYTALWSDTRVSEWLPVLTTDINNRNPDQFAIDTQNRLFIGLKKGAAYPPGGVGGIGGLYYNAPSGGARTIVALSFDYNILLPANWHVLINIYSSSGYGFGGGTTAYGPIVSAGALLTGSASITFAGSYQVEFYIYNNSGATYTFTAEDGANYARLTNVRVKTTSAASVTADLIAADIAARALALNPGVLASATPNAASPGLDLTDVAYEDAAPTKILEALALKGNGVGTVYAAGVDRDGLLTFQPRGTGGRTWYVDVDEVELAAARGDLANSVYAVYQEAGGRTLRTAASTNAASVTRYGRTRQQAVKADTTSATAAAGIRDVALVDRATVPGAAGITIRRCALAGGGPADPRHIRPGDTLVVRNVPLYGSGADVDQVRAFRVGERGYDPIARKVTVTPETRLPRLDVLLAQQAERS